LRAADWSEDLIAAAELDRGLLAPVVPCHHVVGRVSREAAGFTGLADGTPVVAGSMDNVAATLATGVCRAGQACVAAGTATNTNTCHQGASFSPVSLNYHHIVPDLFIAAGAVDYGGAGLRWFRGIVGDPDFAEIDGAVERQRHDSEPLLFLPYMVGQRAPLWNPHARGVLFGIGPETSRTALFRAFMEGNALGTRRVLEMLEEGRSRTEVLRLTGGCANSRIWTQIFADATGRVMEVAGRREASPLGAAINAAVGVGSLRSHLEAESIVKVVRKAVPDRSRSGYYEGLYRLFMDLYESSDGVYRRLHDLVEETS
jgi:sugar (pentulose or hexulose) kinase